MYSGVDELINQAVANMISHTGNNKAIDKLMRKHGKKIHFIPKRYRVFGGMLQSLNIQFGNFIEELMTVIVEGDGRYEIVKTYSGKKNTKFSISRNNERLVDDYITSCQIENYDDAKLKQAFEKLRDNLFENLDADENFFTHDIDLLFKDKITGIYYYLEIKYNDDHDTGKFVDINRKLLKTSAYLIKELNITDKNKFKPILFFFNNKKMKGNPYIPEETNIYRGERFFKEFLSVSYGDVEKYMANLSESKPTVDAFDALYEKVTHHKDKVSPQDSSR